MKKVILTLVALGLAMGLTTTAEAGGRCRGWGPVYYQPAPATAPATTRVDQGYRTFSYQPAAAPAMRYYQAPARRTGGGRAYESAINKSLGRY
jgi:hypothetical protein